MKKASVEPMIKLICEIATQIMISNEENIKNAKLHIK